MSRYCVEVRKPAPDWEHWAGNIHSLEQAEKVAAGYTYYGKVRILNQESGRVVKNVKTVFDSER